MTHKDDLAYPFIRNSDDFSIGMTKREYFAVVALQGILANPEQNYLLPEQAAVQFADRLIKELNK